MTEITTMAEKLKSAWLKSLLIAVPVGLVVGLPFPVLLYLSDAKDWGKDDHKSYWDFAWPYFAFGTMEVLGLILVVWILCMMAIWLGSRIKAR